MRVVLAALSLAALLGPAGRAYAAPLALPVELSVGIPGNGFVTVSGFGTIDWTGGTVTVPAGLISLGSANLVVPVTGTTVIHSLSLLKLSNLSGIFSLGGVTAHAPGEICPTGGPAAGRACNLGGGFGGVMALTGTLNINIIPGFVVIPVNLNEVLIGQGGSTNLPSGYTSPIDAAAWTTGVGLVNTGTNVVVTTGPLGTGFLLEWNLVTPTFLGVAGGLPLIARLTFGGEVPEPSGLLLVALGAAGLAALRVGRRR